MKPFLAGAPRILIRLAGWLPAALSALALGGFLVFFVTIHPPLTFLPGLVEVVVPLGFSLHVAILFAPENEPALELLLTCPVPISIHLRDRLLLVTILHLAIALPASSLVALAWQAMPLGTLLVRWLVPAILFGGLALFTTQLTRQSAYGASLTTLLWAASIYGGDALLNRWPWTWPFHAYLKLEDTTSLHYLLNRITLVLAGALLAFLAFRLIEDEERMIGNR